MKINIYNTKPCKVTFCNEDDGIYDAPYPFDDLNAFPSFLAGLFLFAISISLIAFSSLETKRFGERM